MFLGSRSSQEDMEAASNAPSPPSTSTTSSVSTTKIKDKKKGKVKFDVSLPAQHLVSRGYSLVRVG